MSEDEKIPVAREEAVIGRRDRTTGRVRVEKRVHENVEQRDEALRVQDVEIERVQIGQYVDEAPPIREEDGVLVVPRVREVLVVERRLLLEEEVRIRTTERTEHERVEVPLREEEVVVRRDEDENE